MKHKSIHLSANNQQLLDQAKSVLKQRGFNWPDSLNHKSGQWIKVNLDSGTVSVVKRPQHGATSIIAESLEDIIPSLPKKVEPSVIVPVEPPVVFPKNTPKTIPPSPTPFKDIPHSEKVDNTPTNKNELLKKGPQKTVPSLL